MKPFRETVRERACSVFLIYEMSYLESGVETPPEQGWEADPKKTGVN